MAGSVLVDMNGRILQSYDESRVQGAKRTFTIIVDILAVDRYNNVIMTDTINDRVVLLNPSLALIGYKTLSEHALKRPCSLHFDKLNNRLYIGEYVDTGPVFVLGVSDTG